LTHQSFGQLAVSTSGPGCTEYKPKDISFVSDHPLSHNINIYQHISTMVWWIFQPLGDHRTIGRLDCRAAGAPLPSTAARNARACATRSLSSEAPRS
jgi:hypothetical protein